MKTKQIMVCGLITVVLALVFTACPPEPHTHDWGNWVVTTPATATTPGEETRTCNTCGEKVTRPIPATGNPTHTHTYSTTWSNDATEHWHECTANDGAKSDVANHSGNPCTVCGYNDPAHTHSYSTTWSKDATQHWHECTCGDKTDIANHTGDPCTVCGYTDPEPAHVHDWGAGETTPATTHTEGQETEKCTTCGAIRVTKTLAKLPTEFPIPSGEYTVIIKDGRTNPSQTPLDTAIIAKFVELLEAVVNNYNYQNIAPRGLTIVLRDDVTFETYDPAPSNWNKLDVNFTFASTGNLNGTLNRALFTNRLGDMIDLPNLNDPNYTSENGLFYNKEKTTLIGAEPTITSVTIPAGVTSIQRRAFQGCTSLTSVTIPSSVTTIGEYVFNGCTSLTSVTISANVTTIDDRAFNRCISLASITIPASVTTIGRWAFYGCTSLASITIPSSVTYIGMDAFWGCTSLTSVTIPANVNIGLTSSSVFRNCTSLSSVTISEGVTKIGWGWFYDCTSLASITIPTSVTTIDTYAFWGCTSLTSITIPANVTTINNSVFYSWTNSQTIHVPFANDNETPAEWHANWKQNCNAVIKYWNGTTWE